MKEVLIVICIGLGLSMLGGFSGVDQSVLHLKKGDDAPDFTTTTITGQQISLSTKVKKGNVVILFYQGFWCTGCHKQLSSFKEDLAMITKKGGHTIAISPTPLTGMPRRFLQTNEDVSIVIDEDLSLMRGFGILRDEPSSYTRADKNYGQTHFSFIPATYIVDEHMKVKFAHVDPSFTLNAFVDSLLLHP